jgi:hypothetical protein
MFQSQLSQKNILLASKDHILVIAVDAHFYIYNLKNKQVIFKGTPPMIRSVVSVTVINANPDPSIETNYVINIVDKEGVLYWWLISDPPRPIRFVNGEELIVDPVAARIGPVASVKCPVDYQHQMFLARDGKIFSKGMSRGGSLGRGPMNDFLIGTLDQIRLPGAVKLAACNHVSTLVQLEDNQIFMWGGKTENRKFFSVPKAVEGPYIASPVPVSVLDKKANKTISHLAVGAEYFVVAMEDGEIVTWGRNNVGQLGCGDKEEKALNVFPCTVRGLPKKRGKVVSISTYLMHTLILFEDGKVFGWGENQYGQLGKDPKAKQDCLEAGRIGEQLGAIVAIGNAGYFSLKNINALPRVSSILVAQTGKLFATTPQGGFECIIDLAAEGLWGVAAPPVAAAGGSASVAAPPSVAVAGAGFLPPPSSAADAAASAAVSNVAGAEGTVSEQYSCCAVGCGRPATKMCGGLGESPSEEEIAQHMYCSVECQTRDWKQGHIEKHRKRN